MVDANMEPTEEAEEPSIVQKEPESSTSQTQEQERRYIDGKWMCEDGFGGYLTYENGEWVAAEGDNLKEKWTAASISSNPYRCVVDGVTMEWNQISQQWLPAVEVNEEFLAGYHANYGINYDYGAVDNSSQKVDVDSKTAKKTKLPEKKVEEGWVELDESRNTSVYVSKLPPTITEETFAELMSKCGVIQRDARTNKLKIKLYKNEDGTLKGDGRCCYIKKESVDLALEILDGWNVEGKRISVERAKFEMKGNFDPSKKKKKLTAAQKKRFIESQERIFEWKPEKPRNYRPISDCTIVMKNVFTLEQMMRNAALLLDLEEEARTVCEKFGRVKKVIVHDNNPEGVVCVTFENVEHSDAAVRSLNGRIVDGRQLVVTLWDGKTKYAVEETQEQREERIKQWQDFIANENDEHTTEAAPMHA